MQNNYPIRTPLMNVMVAAVLKASKGILRDFGELDNLQVSRKGVANFVTEADLRTEKILYQELKKARPDFGFLMEEGGEKPGKDATKRWVIDPLDGTTNFMHAVPYFAISLALEETTPRGVELTAGVIFDPVHDEMFMAEKGQGAYCNQRRLRVSERSGDFYFVTGTARTPGDYMQRVSDLTRYASELEGTLRRSGAAALDLAYVAAGRYDAAWFARLQKWDMAAGIVCVREAGGLLSCAGGGEDYYETGCIMAATPAANQMLINFPNDQKRAVSKMP